MFSTSSLQFHDQGYWILKEQYEKYGVDAEVQIRIEWECDDCEDDFKLYYFGRIDFMTYDENCGEDCLIGCNIEDDSILSKLKNRSDTDVDLTSITAFDGLTTMTQYPGLSTVIEVPSKSVLMRSYALNEALIESDNFTNDGEWFVNWWPPDVAGSDPNLESSLYMMTAQFIPGFGKVMVTDILDTTIYDTIRMINGGSLGVPSKGLMPLVEFKPIDSKLKCTSSEAEISFRLKGNIAYETDHSAKWMVQPRFQIIRLPVNLDEEINANYQTIFDYPVDISGPAHSANYDIQSSINVQINEGDRIWYFFFIYVRAPQDWISYTMTEDIESFLDVKLSSDCEPTPANVYMVHEAASRIVESLTNNELKFKSEYYGRIDSQPFSYPVDGCGGLRTVTNGLQLRRAVLPDASNPKVFTNWQVMLDSLNALDCIGFGVERDDITRQQVIRCEPVDYFYKPALVFIADGVNSFSRKVMPGRIWNQFNFGFEKFETESANGLDAIHTKRQFRIPIKNTDQTLEKVCKYILDGYAIEVTRRKFGITDDWRYDQDIFMLCLLRDTGLLKVEQGNIVDDANMFSPDTVMNYRCSPIRNLMRWFRWLVQGVREIDPLLTQLLFNSGEGNYVAKGRIDSPDCVDELIPMAENDPVYQSAFKDITAAEPFIVPEEVTFTFPLGLNEFIELKENIYGLVQFRRDSNEEWQYGWINSLEPNHEDGDAKFTLVTKIR